VVSIFARSLSTGRPLISRRLAQRVHRLVRASPSAVCEAHPGSTLAFPERFETKSIRLRFLSLSAPWWLFEITHLEAKKCCGWMMG
jgi:hypothetical protein